jgi:hypothetical protein
MKTAEQNRAFVARYRAQKDALGWVHFNTFVPLPIKKLLLQRKRELMVQYNNERSPTSIFQ